MDFSLQGRLRVVPIVLAGFSLVIAGSQMLSAQRLQVDANSANKSVEQLRRVFQDQDTTRYGFRGPKGGVAIQPVYDAIKEVSFSVALPKTGIVQFGSQWGLIDMVGEFIAKPVFDEIEFQAGQPLLRVRMEGLSSEGVPRYGFVRQSGETVVKPEWSQATWFVDGLASLQSPVTGKWTAIDTDGQPVHGGEFDQPCVFIDGVATVSVDGKFGLLNTKLKWIVKPMYAKIGSFKEGRARLFRDGHWGYIGPDGKVLIDAVFEDAQEFSEERAGVRMVEHWGYIGPDGKLVARPEYDAVRPFCNGMAMVTKDGKIGYVSHSGELAIEPQFDAAEDFDANGRAIAGSKGEHYMIDRKGAHMARVIPETPLIMVSSSRPIVEDGSGKSPKRVMFIRPGEASPLDDPNVETGQLVLPGKNEKPNLPNEPRQLQLPETPRSKSKSAGEIALTAKPKREPNHKSLLRMPPNIPIKPPQKNLAGPEKPPEPPMAPPQPPSEEQLEAK